MKELTKAEEQIMQVLWKEDKLLVREIIVTLKKPKPAYTTVATFLGILEKKGFVKRKKIANTYQYQTLVNKKTYVNSFIRNFTTRYFDNSPQKMLSFFIDKSDLSLEDVDELQKQLKNKK